MADDFACLVAVEEGGQSVAAVCIEENPQTRRITLRFAALDVSLSDAVKLALQEWSMILSNAASRKESGIDPVDAMFHSIIRLHFPRLLARLRSSKWDKPQYLSKSHKKPLWKDMPNLIHRAVFLYTKKEKAERELVQKLVGELAAVYEEFEISAGEDRLEMEILVIKSHVFSSSPAIEEYLLRLESSVGTKVTPQVAAAVKCLRQIQKIASYRRISVSLVDFAKEYPQLFGSGIRMEFLTPYQSVPTAIGYEVWAKTCHVHAEVQLAVYYDLISHQQRDFLMPRAIGISKSLCYLCYRFLLAHQRFFPSRTHGRLYDQWTIPDISEYEDAVVRQYRGIVKDMDEEVVRHTENEPELWRLEPMTSIDVYCTSSQT